jgi:hypothetical protein
MKETLCDGNTTLHLLTSRQARTVRIKQIDLTDGWNSRLQPCSVLWYLGLFQKPTGQIDCVTNQIQSSVNMR